MSTVTVQMVAGHLTFEMVVEAILDGQPAPPEQVSLSAQAFAAESGGTLTIPEPGVYRIDYRQE